MALADTHAPSSHSLGSILTAPFRGIGRLMVAIMENNSRVQRAERLHAMSDEELAARGIKREDIARVVFADLMYI